MYSPLSLEQILDSDGKPIRKAELFVYQAGTTTPKDVFRTAALDPTKMLPWPIPVDANGRLPAIFVGQGDYDVLCTDGFSVSPPGAVLFSAQGLPGDPPPAVAPVFDPARQYQTGDYIFTAGSGGRNGSVPCNGGTIGNANSGASTRANADCAALFAYLWGSRADLPLIPGRGLSAVSDFNSGVQLTLPDLSSRLLAFAADGSGAGNLFAEGKIDFDPGTLIGLRGGEATHTLSADEMPEHAHLAHFTGDAVGDHNHIADVGVESDTHEHSIGTKRYVILSAGGTNQTVVSFYAIPDGDTGPVLSATGGESRQHVHAVTTRLAGGFTPGGEVKVDNTGLTQKHNTLPPFIVAGAVHLKL